jgi:hypothetical protein
MGILGWGVTLTAQQYISPSTFVLSPCSNCCLGKLSKVPLASRPHHSTKPFQLILSDVWGPAPVRLA